MVARQFAARRLRANQRARRSPAKERELLEAKASPQKKFRSGAELRDCMDGKGGGKSDASFQGKRRL